MSLSVYDVFVDTYIRLLKAMSKTLAKAEAHAASTNTDPSELIAARLYPDMWNLAQQVGAACNHAIRGTCRVSGREIPKFEFGDKTFADLQGRLAAVIAFLEGVTPESMEGGEAREVVFPLDGGERRMSGQQYLLSFSLPNFYFHTTTAYDILRNRGVPLRKDDFTGN